MAFTRRNRSSTRVVGAPRRLRAQALVEFAIVLPVTLIMLMGMYDLGRSLVFGVAVQEGAREGARLASRAEFDTTVDDTAVAQRVIAGSAPALGTNCTTTLSSGNPPKTCTDSWGSTWTFTYVVAPSSGSTTYSSLAAARAAGASLANARFEVKVSGSVALFSAFRTGAQSLSLPQISVQGDVSMPIL